MRKRHRNEQDLGGMLGSALLVSLAATVSAWGVVAPSPASRAVASLKRTSHVVHMKDEEISFSFGDAADISTETMEAMVDEEREMTDKEKEIARLRAAEKFMKKDTGNAMCQTCGYKYKWEEGVPGSVPPIECTVSASCTYIACPPEWSRLKQHCVFARC